MRLGIDVACRADHQASCADAAGEFLWSGWRFRTTPSDLQRLWAKVPEGADVTVILEPTRNAWVPVAAWLRARGAKAVMVPPEQSADLRDYYNKHTKTDRLDSRILARLPLLHPDGLRSIDHLGPAEPLLRAVRQRSSLVRRRTATAQRLDCLVELLGPAWGDVFGRRRVQQERPRRPRALRRSPGAAQAGPQAAHDAAHPGQPGRLAGGQGPRLAGRRRRVHRARAAGGLDFEELAADIATEVRLLRNLNAEIAAMDDRNEALYEEADPKGIVVSTPGIGVTLAAGILGRLGDPTASPTWPGCGPLLGWCPRSTSPASRTATRG